MCRARSPSLDLLGRRKEEEKKKEKRTIIAFTDTLCEKNVMSLKRVFFSLWNLFVYASISTLSLNLDFFEEYLNRDAFFAVRLTYVHASFLAH